MWYREALDSIGAGVIVADRYGRLAFINPAAKEMIGWNGNGNGADIPDVLHLVDETTGQAIENPFSTVMREGTFGDTGDLWMLATHDGAVTTIEVTGTRIQDESGVVDGVIFVRKCWSF